MRRAAHRSEEPPLLRSGVVEHDAQQGKDPRCAHPECRGRLTLTDDKPDVGWATVTLQRHNGKAPDRRYTLFLCPAHSLVTIERQTRLFG